MTTVLQQWLISFQLGLRRLFRRCRRSNCGDCRKRATRSSTAKQYYYLRLSPVIVIRRIRLTPDSFQSSNVEEWWSQQNNNTIGLPMCHNSNLLTTCIHRIWGQCCGSVAILVCFLSEIPIRQMLWCRFRIVSRIYQICKTAYRLLPVKNWQFINWRNCYWEGGRHNRNRL